MGLCVDRRGLTTGVTSKLILRSIEIVSYRERPSSEDGPRLLADLLREQGAEAQNAAHRYRVTVWLLVGTLALALIGVVVAVAK